MSPIAKSNLAFGIIALVVLVIAGAFLFPIFNRRKTIQARQHPLVQDGRVLGNAAQQYFLTSGQKSVSFDYDSTTGKITGPLTPWVTSIGKGYTFHDNTIELDNPAAFTLSHPSFRNGQPIPFTDEGKTTFDPSR